MGLFQEFSNLFPYLDSVRKLKDYLSFDVHLPSTWKLPKKYVDEKMVIEQESKQTNHRLFSFVCEINESAIEKNTTNIQNIIKYNLEREEKEQLFELKVQELKIVFEKQSLESLKNLKFSFKPTKIEFEDGEEQIETTGVV